MFLTKEEMQRLTGYIVHKKQVDWLRKHGIRCMTNRYGQPLVTEKQIEEMLGVGMQRAKARIEPDADALKRAMRLQ